MMVGIYYDANVILVEPIKNRQDSIRTHAWTMISARFEKVGNPPHTYVIDNEISGQLIDTLPKANTGY